MRLSLVLAFLLLATGCGMQQDHGGGDADDDGPAALTQAPVVGVAHGALMLPDGRFVEPTLELAKAAHAYYIARLLDEADEDTQQRFTATKRDLRSRIPAGPTQALRLEAALLDWLNDHVVPDDMERIAQINDAVRRAFHVEPMPVPGGTDAVTQALSTSLGGQAYVDACRAAGVPTPPAWGSSGWTRVPNSKGPETNGNPLLTRFVFENKDAEVYTFMGTTPARGTCIALARSETRVENGAYTTLGIICQGVDTSKACFWDNAINIPRGQEHAIVSSSFFGGADLFGKRGGRCTVCHAGENAYIVHPGTALDRGTSFLRAKSWVHPLVHADWPQNIGPGRDLERVVLPAGQSSCLSCHNKASHNRFPPLAYLVDEDTTFCNSVAQPATVNTMPPPDASGSSAYAAHKTAIIGGCSGKPSERTRFGATATWHTGLGGNNTSYTMGDFNNDGRSDVALVFINIPAAPGVYVSLSNGSTFGPLQTWLTTVNGLNMLGGLYAADVSGDGRDDLIAMNTTGAFVMVSSGASFAGPVKRGPGTVAGQRTAFGDINYDSIDDLVQFRQNASEVWVSMSNGTSFGPAARFRTGFSPAGDIPFVADFNADGFEDVATVHLGSSQHEVFVALGAMTGASFGSATRWLNVTAASDFPFVADVNFDGRADFVWFSFSGNGDVLVSLARSSSSFAAKTVWHGSFLSSGQIMRVGDVNGDLFSDVISFSTIDGDARVAKSAP